tara:strand:- start:1457 stop:1849 length:393 start_codon:yes stop_codon:yes gene_type:complete
MNKYILTLIFLITFSSCTITRQYYAFDHHGTESVKTNSDFKYVARNVMGKAKTTIKLSAWKRMKQDLVTDGLLADAKSQLPDLGNNQTYANLSVDLLRTETGSGAPGGGINIREIVLELVVSADIIEYVN